jgi:hypothetical protein
MDKHKKPEVQLVNSSKTARMYEESKEWISRIEFYNDSLIGLKNIIDSYLDEIIIRENLDEIRECVMRLQDFKYTCKLLLKEVQIHQSKLTKHLANKQVESLVLDKAHQIINAKLNGLTTEYYEMKNEVFFITEYAMEVDKEEKLTIELEKIKASRYS